MTTPFALSATPMIRTQMRRFERVTSGTVMSQGVPFSSASRIALLDGGAGFGRIEREGLLEIGPVGGIELVDAIDLFGPDRRHGREVELPAADARHRRDGVEQIAAATHLGFGRFGAEHRGLERHVAGGAGRCFRARQGFADGA